MGWFKNSFGAASGVFLAAMVFAIFVILIAGTAYLYVRQESIAQDEKARERDEQSTLTAINTVVDVFIQEQRDILRDKFIELYGLEMGNDVHERLLYLEKLFTRDSYQEIGQAVLSEISKRQTSETTINLPGVLYDLTVLAGEKPSTRFIPFLANNVVVFPNNTRAIIRVEQSQRAQFEGEDTTPMSVKTYYRQSGEERKSTTPGYVYAPQVPVPDPGYNTQRVTRP